MPLIKFNGKEPKVHNTCYIASNATLIGDVSLGRESSVWPNVVIRGDLNKIVIGERTNIQDGCIIHVDLDKPTLIGNGVIMGHGAIAHACTIGDNVLIGIGANVLSSAVIENSVIVAAGSVVKEGTTVPNGVMVTGIPAKVKKNLDSKHLELINYWIKEYVKLNYLYKENEKYKK
jgi:carbonic anhydrase/acetyltransferase-like protein (isoleucine patch superfamily)